jgi:hypothetical protein
MRKLIIALALALAVLAPTAAADDVRGPACADITGGGFVFDGSAVTGSARLKAPACTHVIYTLYVLDSPGDTEPLASGTGTPTETGSVLFNVPATDGDGVVCVYAETSIGRHVFDRAPNTGCVEVTSASGGQEGFN